SRLVASEALVVNGGDPGAAGQARGRRGGGRTLLAQDLDGDLAFPGAVQLGEDHRLEAPEGELAVDEPHGDVAAEQRGAQMRVRVAALAVREARIVVAIAAPLGHEPLDETLEVVDERALELVDEERARGVQRVDER